MNRAHAPLLIAMAVVLVASACLTALPLSASAPDSPSPSLALTDAGKPAGSTATFTATRLNPTQTPSITMTPFPSITPLPSATATATDTPFGFVPSKTPTAIIIPTLEPHDPDEGATDEWGSETRCSLISKSPPNWTEVRPGGQYQVSWTLLNSGTKTWQANQMVLVYYNGAKLTPPDHKKTSLAKDVRVGQTITTSVNIYTPKAPGHYKAVWALRMIATNHVFCTFTIKIFVQ